MWNQSIGVKWKGGIHWKENPSAFFIVNCHHLPANPHFLVGIQRVCKRKREIFFLFFSPFDFENSFPQRQGHTFLQVDANDSIKRKKSVIDKRTAESEKEWETKKIDLQIQLKHVENLKLRCKQSDRFFNKRKRWHSQRKKKSYWQTVPEYQDYMKSSIFNCLSCSNRIGMGTR